jgi:DNA-binding transcriptional LysR family regulator
LPFIVVLVSLKETTPSCSISVRLFFDATHPRDSDKYAFSRQSIGNTYAVNLRQLEYFVAIAEEGSVTRAADRLFVAQPSLSQQIAALEAELGGALLERMPRGVRLTMAGQSFLPEARAAISHAERARRSVRMALGLEAGQLQVAAITSTAAGILPSVLRRWQELHPEIEVSLAEFLHRRALEESVRDGVSDMAVGAPPAKWEGTIEPLGWEELVVVLPRDDPLLRRRSIDLAALAERRWVHFAPSHGLAEVIDLQCAAAGFTPRAALRTSQVAVAPQFAAAGLGPTLVPEHVVAEGLRELVRPAKPRLVRPVVALTRGDWSPIARAFLEILHEHPWPRRPRGAIDLG